MNTSRTFRTFTKAVNVIVILTTIISQFGWGASKALADASSQPVITEKNSPTVNLIITATSPECADPLGCITIDPADPLHIAYALVTEGPDASLGIDSRNGVEIAIDDSGGQILGHAIQFDGLNESCSAEGGLAAGTALAADPSIVAVIGTSCSSAAREAMPLLSAAGMVMVSPSNTASDLTEAGNPNNYPGYLRTSIPDSFQGAAAAQFAYNSLKITTAATIEDGSLYSDFLQTAFVNEFIGLGGTITSMEVIDPGETDMSTVLGIILGDPPELIYFPIFMPAGGYLISQARETTGFETTYLMASDGMYTPEVVAATGGDVEGFLVTGPDTSQYSPDYKNVFLPAYKAKFGTEPLSFYHAHAYDAFMLIKAAIEEVAVVDPDGTLQIGRQALRDTLYGTTGFAGLTGTLTCSPTGDCADPHIGAFRYHAGQDQPRRVWPTLYTANVGLITSVGGIADQGFNWLSWQGVLQAETDLGIVGTLYEPTSEDQYAALLQQCVDDGNELCIGVGFFLGVSLANAARANPDTKWGIVDYSYPDCWPGAVEGIDCGSFTEIPNVRGFTFDSGQTGYLAGALAGKMTTSNVIGTVAGMDIPPVASFVNGYRNGAQCANPDVNVLVNYTGTFSDSALGATIAAGMLSKGADAIFGVGGLTGQGAILYAAQNDAWSIGVDVDEYLSTFGNGSVDGSDMLLTSAMKGLDVAVYQTIEDYLYGSFTSGNVLYALADGGVGLAPYHETDSIIPQSVKDYLAGVRQDIIDGVIDISQTCRPDYSPNFSVRANFDQVEAWEWPLGAMLELEIDDPGTELNPDHSETQIVSPAPWDPSQTYVNFNLWGTFDIQAGYLVSMSDGTMTKTLTVSALAFTDFDIDADTVFGIADADARVNVSACDSSTCANRHVDADGDGNWLADFANPGGEGDEQDTIDLVRGTWVDSQQTDDDGDATKFGWNIPNPRIAASPNSRWIWASDWPLGTLLTLTIDDPSNGVGVDYTTTATAEHNPGDPHGITANFDWPAIGLKPGFEVTVDGGGTTKTLIISPLTVTAIDPVLDTISGVATPGVQLNVCANANVPDNCINRYVTASIATGLWTADYGTAGIPPDDTATFDLVPGSNGWVYEDDSDADRTWVDWRVPNPNLHVFVTQDRIEARDWPDGHVVTLTIDNPVTPDSPDYTTTRTMGPAPWNPNEIAAEFDLNGIYHYQVGDLITVSDGTSTKTHVVMNVNVTGIDAEAGTISGTTDPGAEIQVNIHRGNAPYRRVTADGSGVWSVDFSVVWEDQGTYDLTPGLNGSAMRFDDDGDVSRADWRVPNPNFQVRANNDLVEGWEWTQGDVVTLVIDDPGTGQNQDYTDTQIVGSWDGDPQYVNFNLGGVFDIQPGFLVSLSDGTTTKTHTVTGLEITGFDIDNDLVYGLAGPGTRVDVWACDGKNCYNRHVDADGGGNWTADFAHPGVEGDEQNTFDLVRGTWLDSHQCDEDGDCTQFGMNIPNPYIQASPSSHWVHGRGWPLGTELTLTIDDPSNGVGVDYTKTATVKHNPDKPDDILADFTWPDQFTPGPGYVITMTGDILGSPVTKTLIVALLVLSADPVTDIVSGVATPGVPNVEVCLWRPVSNCFWLYPSVDGTTGEWNADYTAQDLQPGDSGWVTEYDPDSDETWYYWGIPNPNFQVRANNDQVEGREWPLGATLKLEIFCSGYYTETKIVGPAPWDPSQTYVNFNLWGVFDIQPECLVSLNDGTTNKTHTVTGLEITGFDIDNDLVYGVAGPGTRVDVWACDGKNCFNRHVNAELDGNWLADFAHPGVEGDEQNTFDIVRGTWLDSHQCDEDGDCTQFGMNIPNPRFDAWYKDGNINAYDWPLGTLLTLDIDATIPADGVPEYSVTTTVGQFNLNGAFDIQPGMTLTVSGAGVTKILVVSDLAVTDIDPATDVITGTAGPNQQLWMNFSNASGDCCRNFQADGSGVWTVDYSELGSDGEQTEDIRLGSSGTLNAQDEDGDNTSLNWYVPTYTLHVNIKDNETHGHDWPQGDTVTLIVDDDTDPNNGVLYSQTKNADDDTSCGYPCFNLQNIFNLQIGQYVTMTDGSISKTVHISTLHITDMNAQNDTLSGVADPGSEVMVNIKSQNGMRRAIADTNGDWTVNFSIPGSGDDEQDIADIIPGDSGRAIQLNPDGTDDGTLEYWRVPNPRFSVQFPWNEVHGYEWPLGALVTLTIDDPSTPSTDYSQSKTVDMENFKPPADTWIGFKLGDFQVRPGYVVTMTDSATTKTHVVQELEVIEVNPVTDTISGTAAPGSDVYFGGVCDKNGCAYRHVLADNDGDWLADFSIPGDEGDEQETFDLRPGSSGEAQRPDEDGDATVYQWRVPNPNFQVRANNDQVEGWEWTQGDVVTLAIDDPGTGQNPDYTDTQTVGLAPWDPNQTYVNFSLEGVLDIQPGFVVSMTDGTTLKIHTVTNLAFTNMDIDTDTVSGIATPGARVDVWACDSSNCYNRHMDADGGGNWLADFAHPGVEGDEQNTFDLVPGTWVDSQQSDEDGDRTMFGRNIPNTHIEAEAWNNRVTGYEFAPGADITLRVDDPSTPDDPDFEQTQSADGNGWVEFWPPLDILPGFVVTMTDGTTNKTLVVSVLHATADETANTIFGMASPNTQLWFWLEDFNPGDKFGLDVSVGALGSWSVDLDGLYTLHTWNFGGVNETDPDGDVTYYRWRVVHPTIEAWVNENSLKLFDWPLGADLTVSIDDPATTDSPDYVTYITTEPIPWFEGAWAYLQLHNAIFLAPGMEVTVTDGVISDTLTISTIQITGVDLDLDTITGIADPDTQVFVSLGFGGDTRAVTSDEDGNWTVDFSGSSDISYGTDVIVSVHDEDWDATFFEFYAGAGIPCLAGDMVYGYAFGSDGSTPVGGVTVHFDDFDSETPLFTARTTSDGWYSCGNLSAGSYRIWVDRGSANGADYSRQYYPETIFENAARVEVDASTHLADVNFVYQTPSATYLHMDFNMDRPITGELAVRQAIAYGTDRQRIIDEVLPGRPIMDSFITPGSWSYASSGLPHYGYDPVLAGDILTAAGWVDSDPDGVRERGGVRLHIDIRMRNEPHRIQAAQIFVENMAAIGIEVELKVDENWVEIIASHDFDLALFGWVSDENADFGEDGLWWLFKSDGPYNHGLYNNPEVDGLLEDIRPLRTRAEVLPYAVEIQIDVMTDLATLPIFGWWSVPPPTADAGVDRTVLEGATVTLDGSGSSDPYNDIVLYEWDLDNDGDYDDALGVNPDVSFPDNGTYTVGLKVTDAYSMYGTDTVEFTVQNVPPTATFNAPTWVGQGTNIVLSLTDPQDVSPADVTAGFQYAFDCGDGLGYGSFGSASSVNCPTAGASGTRTVGGKIQDKDGGFTEYTSQVNIVSPPTNVQASDGTYTNKVLVSWNASSGATSYKVYRAASAAGGKSLLGSPTGTTFDDTTATPGITYYYWVKACRSSSCSTYSAYNTGWRKLSAPTNVQASDGTYTDKVLVSWNASSGATSYKVYRADSAAGGKSLLGNPTVTSFNDTTATPGVTYYYWVTACRSSRCSSYSAYNTGWSNLSAPVNVQASDGTYTDKVNVTWNASSGATSYKVYRATSATGTKSLLGSPTGSAFDDTTATPGVSYWYWLTACNGANCSGFSAYNTGWRKLSPPANVLASDGTYTDKVRVSWIPSSGATSYKVYRATSATGTKSPLGSPTVTSFNDTTATPGVTYYYWVKACSGANCSDFSAYDTGWRKLSAPTNVQASDGTYTDKVNVTWNASSGATSYKVYRATSATGTKSPLGSPTVTSFNDTTATPGVTYYYWVKACSGANCSDLSAYDTGWRKLSAPTNVQASDGTHTNKVLVSWYASSGATSYKVYRATSATGTKSLLGSPTGLAFDDTTATQGVIYWYWVKACSGANCSDFSAYNTGWRNLSAPTNVQASDGTYTDKVLVSWNASSGATSYKVYRATSAIGTKSLLGSPTGTSFNDTTATPGVTYYYWVTACRDSRCSSYSAYNTGWRKKL